MSPNVTHSGAAIRRLAVSAVCVTVALLISVPAVVQEKTPKKKPAAKQVAHKKATPEQIRKFNELQKKQQ